MGPTSSTSRLCTGCSRCRSRTVPRGTTQRSWSASTSGSGRWPIAPSMHYTDAEESDAHHHHAPGRTVAWPADQRRAGLRRLRPVTRGHARARRSGGRTALPRVRGEAPRGRCRMSPSIQYHVAFEGGRYDGEHGWAKPYVIPPAVLYLADNDGALSGVGYYIEPGDGRYEYL